MRALISLTLICITISLDAQYYIGRNIFSNAFSISPNQGRLTGVYVDKSNLKQDLSNLPYLNNLRVRLFDLGHSVTKDINQANYILKFEAKTGNAIVDFRESTEEVQTPERTIEIKTENGTTKEITVEGQQTEIPTVIQTRTWRKSLKLKLYKVSTNELIWQGESWMDDNEPNGQYPKLLIYDVLRNFLRNSKEDPIINYYNRRNFKKIRELFYIPKY